MKITSIVAVASTIVLFGMGSLQAQTLNNGQVPAEFPPDSFTGTQYVDSAGCVFIRAGIDGNVTWVPRVNRQRQQICGQTPSLNAAQLAEARGEGPQDQASVQITVDPPPSEVATATQAQTAAPQAAAPAPAQRREVVQSAPAQQRQATTTSPTATATPTPAAGSAPRVTRDTRAAAEPTANARVLPRHLYEKRLQEQAADILPAGYKRVWTDDRLNIRRAEQTMAGIEATRLIWTDTVPRRLINPDTGQDLTASEPLVFPYTDTATQERDLGTVQIAQRDGQTVKIINRNRAKARKPAFRRTERATPAATPKATAAGRYVQLATFGVPANAQATAQRLIKAGQPAKIGLVTRKGQPYQIVLTGPYTSSEALNAGLNTARAMGFRDAFVR